MVGLPVVAVLSIDLLWMLLGLVLGVGAALGAVLVLGRQKVLRAQRDAVTGAGMGVSPDEGEAIPGCAIRCPSHGGWVDFVMTLSRGE